MQDGCVRIAAIIVVAIALATVTFGGRRSTYARGALAIALACDIVANVERSSAVALDVAIVSTFVAAVVLIVDVATVRVRSTTVEPSVAERAREREDRTA